MAESAIADKARFDQIRYAQLWEDADVLLLGLGEAPGAEPRPNSRTSASSQSCA